MKPNRYIVKAERALVNVIRAAHNRDRRRVSYWTQHARRYAMLGLERAGSRFQFDISSRYQSGCGDVS